VPSAWKNTAQGAVHLERDAATRALTAANAIDEVRHRHAKASPGRRILVVFTGYLHATWKPKRLSVVATR
jgi:hypothetical protein